MGPRKRKSTEPTVVNSEPTDGHNNHSFRLNINSYDGDPDLFEFFAEQFRSFVTLNNYKASESLAFLKSKLTGAALKYYTESPRLKEISCPDTLLSELKSFFSTSSHASSLQALNSLALLPSESIKNLSHRISVLVEKVHPQISDKTALNSIKYVKLLSSLPSEIRVKIMESNITDFNEAVERANNLQNILIENRVLNSIQMTEPSTSLQAEVHSLRQTIEELKQSQTKVPNNTKHHRPMSRQDRYSQQRPVCSFCNKRGHIMRDCFQFKGMIQPHNQRGSSHQRNHKHRRNHPYNSSHPNEF